MPERKNIEPFTMIQHKDLLEKINNLSLAIKLHTLDMENLNEKDTSAFEKAKETHPMPTWEDMENLLKEISDELQNCRYNPIKY